MSELDFSLRPVWKPEAFANGAKVVESAAAETSAPDESSALGDTSLVDSWPTGPFVYEKEWLLKFQAEHKARPAQLGDSPVVSSPEEQERLRAAVLQQQSEREKHFEQQKQNNKIRPQLKQRGPKRNANNEDTPTLVKGEDRWMPSAQDKKKHTKTLEQQFTSLLNKLTLENFTILTRQMVELARDVASRAQLTALVQLVFEQAISEQKFSTMYAQLCAILAVHVPFFESEQSGAKLSFRSELLNTCQQFFQDEHIDDMADYLKAQHPDADKTELQEAEVKYRARIMGNVKFIGELYKLNVLSSKILLRYIVTPLLHISLGKTDDSQEVQEMALEKLAKLFMSSGQAIESRSPEQMQEYLTHMQELSSSSQSPRLRFLLLDLLELQKNAWVARRKAEAPQRIGALHAAAGDADYDHHLPADVLTNMAQLAASLPKPSGPPRRDAPVDGWRRCVPGGGSADGATNSTGAGNSSSSTASTSNGGSARRVSFATPTKSLEDRVAGMVEELLTSHDVDEALLQYKELGPSSDGGEYVRLAFHEVATALNANVDILTKFFKALPSDALRTGHAAFSKELDDVKIDNPNCTKTLTPLFKNLKL